jgi:alpha-ribazole phosphatase/probable phosphoglycerate mutase
MITLFYSPNMTSIGNEAGRASGHADIPLSVAGQRLAQELGRDYATETLDVIFSSDLQGASTTAQDWYKVFPLLPGATGKKGKSVFREHSAF